MIPAWARVGAKVVCVDASPDAHGQMYLRERKTYTIYASHLSGHLQLIEVPREHEDDAWYLVSRFRPLITRTQSEDVAQFLSLLDSIDA